MISKIKKLFLYISFLFLLSIIVLASIYSLLVYKPDNGIKFIDKILVLNYSVNIESISSNKKLLNPFFIFKEIQVNDNQNNELIYIPNLKIGLNLFESIINDYLSLSILEIDTIKSSNNSSTSIFEPFLIKGHKLKIYNDDINITATEFETLISPNNSKILLSDGNINEYSFKKIKALLDSFDNKLFYESSHSFNSMELDQINSIDLSSLKDHEIYIGLDSKGYIDLKTNENKRFDRLKFKKSRITTNSDFIIKDINLIAYSDLNNELLGIFDSVLPDQNISGSIFYDFNKSIIRTNLTINMDGIIDTNRYFSMNGNEVFRSTIVLSEENFSIELLSNLSNTKITSSINEINDKLNENLETSIFVKDMSSPKYQVKNKYVNALIDRSGRGYFAFGNSFLEKINKINHKDGFYVYLDLDNLSLDNIFYDKSSEDNDLLKAINIKTKKFSFSGWLRNEFSLQWKNINAKKI